MKETASHPIFHALWSMAQVTSSHAALCVWKLSGGIKNYGSCALTLLGSDLYNHWTGLLNKNTRFTFDPRKTYICL